MHNLEKRDFKYWDINNLKVSLYGVVLLFLNDDISIPCMALTLNNGVPIWRFNTAWWSHVSIKYGSVILRCGYHVAWRLISKKHVIISKELVLLLNWFQCPLFMCFESIELKFKFKVRVTVKSFLGMRLELRVMRVLFRLFRLGTYASLHCVVFW